MFLVCYKVSDPSTLYNVKNKWMPEIRQYRSNAPVILCGCQSDLRNDSEVISSLGKRGRAPVTPEQALGKKKNLHWRLNNKLLSVHVQVNFCRKLLFLHQLTHNMTSDCSLNYKLNTWKLQAQTWGKHVVYINCFWHSEQFLYTTCSPHVLQKEQLYLYYGCS